MGDHPKKRTLTPLPSPLVSVIIPLYNKAPYIGRTLVSVLVQTVQHFEVVVVDDGSTDNGHEIVESFSDPRIRLVRQENHGVSAARNRGVATASGNLLALLDADDLWKPNFLETALSLERKYPDAGLYALGYELAHRRRTVPMVPAGVPDGGGIVGDPLYAMALSKPNLISTSSVMLSRQAFNEAGGFPEGFSYGEDDCLWIKIAMTRDVVFAPDICSTYRLNAENRLCLNHSPIEEWQRLRYLRKLASTGEMPSRHTAGMQAYLERRYLDAAMTMIRTGQYADAKKLIVEAPDTGLFRKSRKKCRLLLRLPSMALSAYFTARHNLSHCLRKRA